MHQHPRVPPVTASPARSPQTNPMRSNNSRDQLGMHARQLSENSSTPSEQGIYMTERSSAPTSSRDPTQGDKLSLIVQNYFYKAALTILDARTSLPQAFTTKERDPRVNRWFNIEIPETNALAEHTRRWRTAGATSNRPPDMVIETYIDLQDLPMNQKLVVLDDYGKRWDVETALKDAFIEYDTLADQTRQHCIVLERWFLQLGQPMQDLNGDYDRILPKVYKNSIILYRSLFAYLKFMPAWKLCKRTSRGVAGQPMPKLKWRIYDPLQQEAYGGLDPLTVPLFAGQAQVTDNYAWDPIDCPAGQFTVKARFRTNCDFRIDTPESLFTSQFMAHDEQLHQPSLPQPGLLGSRTGSVKPRPAEMGSLPSENRDLPAKKKLDEIAEQGPAYGSLSTFHAAGGRIGTSPLSALRAARELYGRSPTESSSQNDADDSRLNIGSDSSARSNAPPAGVARRTSVSIQPFKTPAFSSSVPLDLNGPASPRVGSSAGRPSPLGQVSEARRPSLYAAQVSPRTSPDPAGAIAVPSSASSPRPAPARFSSSFSHRRNRPSVSGTSRTEDDASSGRASVSSTNAPSGPSGDVSGPHPSQSDDDNISDFLKMLDQKKELKSFKKSATSGASGPQAFKGTTAGLSKFHQLRDSHVALSESISSSQMLQRSSVSSASRQLANVPPMVAGTSASASSSPGERISPRTPHTPAIPSRLSSNSIIEYNQDARRPRAHRYSQGDDAPLRERAEEHGVLTAGPDAASAAGAIPIPTSPRPYRRSSSVHANQHHRERARNERYDVTDNFEDILPFALRSASMGDGEEREPLSLSALVRLQDTSGPIPTGVLPPPAEIESDLDSVGVTAQDTGNISRVDGTGRHTTQRGRGHGRVSSLAQEERAVFSGSSSPGSRPGTGRSGSGSMESRPSRHSFTRNHGISNFEDDEVLLFAMSEQLENSGGAGGNGTGSGSASGRGRLQQW